MKLGGRKGEGGVENLVIISAALGLMRGTSRHTKQNQAVVLQTQSSKYYVHGRWGEGEKEGLLFVYFGEGKQWVRPSNLKCRKKISSK
jgi:hypothetical protein